MPPQQQQQQQQSCDNKMPTSCSSKIDSNENATVTQMYICIFKRTDTLVPGYRGNSIERGTSVTAWQLERNSHDWKKILMTLKLHVKNVRPVCVSKSDAQTE
ncbi:hypothetical protein EAI_13957 [Harpegnathos saltator]|uniref:Uncharacterized protein n=1 Tax=Harpegnathos saltator TaxID=610380 RepID=E2B393_HARSA|nr:hypothetical protein EAI_13957 [Harpegnathos saltator]